MAQKADDMDETGLEGSLTEAELKVFRTQDTAALAVYDEINSDLRDRVRDYLVDGKDATCLLELPAAYQKEGRKEFFPSPFDRSESTARKMHTLSGLFEIGPTHPAYYRRLGEFGGLIPHVQNFMFHGIDGFPRWLNQLLVFKWSCAPVTDYVTDNPVFPLRRYLRDVEDSQTINTLVKFVLKNIEKLQRHFLRYLCPASDWAEILDNHCEVVVEALDNDSADFRESLLRWLLLQGYDFHQVLHRIADLAVDTKKNVRQVALIILRESPVESVGLLTQKLDLGKAAERVNVIEAMAFINSADSIGPLKSALSKETGQRVRGVIEKALIQLEATSAPSDGKTETDINRELSPIELPLGELPLPDGFEEALWQQLEAAFEQEKQNYHKRLAEFSQANRSSYLRRPNRPARPDRVEYAKVIEFISKGNVVVPEFSWNIWKTVYGIPNWSKWAELEKLHLLHVIRFMMAFGLVEGEGAETLGIRRHDWLEAHRRAQAEPYGLRELDAAFATLPGLASGAIAETYLNLNHGWSSQFDWEPEAIWPLFAEHSKLLCDAFSGATKKSRWDFWQADRRRSAIKVAGMFPSMPREIEEAVWSVALGEGKSDRPLARKALLGSPSALPRALAAVKDGRQAVRIAGAEFLGELGDDSAIDPLKKALKAEKLEMVKGALLQAIEQLGGDVDEFLGRRKQLLDAKK
ncbi:MAG: HEAT repeat domain-containing protein, partial [Planctomycetaceae bacterium]|nr:HEAT repeat domain-containing protein [Planctomycetaceae bacterium]